MKAENHAKDTFEDTWATSRAEKMPASPLRVAPPRSAAADQGPCLFLGAAGQRCDRRALAGGYCAIHRPGSSKLPKPAFSKRALAAIIAASGFLWPYLVDLVREIARWMHSH